MSNESAKSNSSHKASPTIQLNKKYEDINLKQKLQEAYRQNQSFTEEGT